MAKTIIAEGKTTAEAVENGLKKLKVSKDKVDIKVLENKDKRSFFSILTPRVVQVELTLKENVKETKQEVNTEKENKVKENKEVKKVDLVELEEAKLNVEKFLKEFVEVSAKNQIKDLVVEIKENDIIVDIKGEDTGFLIGYRGDTLNSLQTVLNSIANKNSNAKIRVLLDIESYRSKREKTLEGLADKISKTVIKTGKSVTLEPMTAYERKIIHSRLQNSKKVQTTSIGEEPYRKVVISRI